MKDKEEEKKANILNSAKILFARFGLEKTTMDDIAKAVKMGKSSLYYYFKSKENVFAEVIRKEMSSLKTNIEHAVENVDDPKIKLKIFIISRIKYLKEMSDQYTTIKDEYLRHYEFIENLRENYSKWEISIIRKILKDGIEKGMFEISNINVVANALFFALKGLEYPWTVNLESKEIEKSANILIDILFKGVETK